MKKERGGRSEEEEARRKEPQGRTKWEKQGEISEKE